MQDSDTTMCFYIMRRHDAHRPRRVGKLGARASEAELLATFAIMPGFVRLERGPHAGTHRGM